MEMGRKSTLGFSHRPAIMPDMTGGQMKTFLKGESPCQQFTKEEVEINVLQEPSFRGSSPLDSFATSPCGIAGLLRAHNQLHAEGQHHVRHRVHVHVSERHHSHESFCHSQQTYSDLKTIMALLHCNHECCQEHNHNHPHNSHQDWNRHHHNHHLYNHLNHHHDHHNHHHLHYHQRGSG